MVPFFPNTERITTMTDIDMNAAASGSSADQDDLSKRLGLWRLDS
jgi:hypothetical protein